VVGLLTFPNQLLLLLQKMIAEWRFKLQDRSSLIVAHLYTIYYIFDQSTFPDVFNDRNARQNGCESIERFQTRTDS